MFRVKQHDMVWAFNQHIEVWNEVLFYDILHHPKTFVLTCVKKKCFNYLIKSNFIKSYIWRFLFNQWSSSSSQGRDYSHLTPIMCGFFFFFYEECLELHMAHCPIAAQNCSYCKLGFIDRVSVIPNLQLS